MKQLPRIVGITGRAGSGKDTLAAALIDTFGYTRRGLADPIKELLNARFGWSAAQWDDRGWKERPAVSTFNLLDEGRHAMTERYLSPRQLAQWLGTEVGRDTFGEDAWVNALFVWWGKAQRPMLVVPDVRFDNEALAIRTRGGVILNVVRPGVEAVNDHVSELGVSSSLVDLHLLNDRDITSFLRASLAAFTEQLPY